MHNQVIHCQTLESISCLFTNLLVIWYRDKVPNQLVSNKNLLSFSLWRRITQVAHLSHGTKATNTQLFFLPVSTTVSKYLQLHGWRFIIAGAVAYTLRVSFQHKYT